MSIGTDGGAGALPPAAPPAQSSPTVTLPVDHTAGAPDFSQDSVNSQSIQAQSGIASLTFGANVFRFRTNPNKINWTYQLITHVEDTYGGRVVQILGVRLGELTISVDCGRGGWPYAMKLVRFMNNMLSYQRGGMTAQFEYTTRNWLLNVYALNVPFQDSYDATVRELTLQFHIQEDVSGIQTSASLSAELNRLQDGIGWFPSMYNQPSGSQNSGRTTQNPPIDPDPLQDLPATEGQALLNYAAATLAENSGPFAGVYQSIITGGEGDPAVAATEAVNATPAGAAIGNAEAGFNADVGVFEQFGVITGDFGEASGGLGDAVLI